MNKIAVRRLLPNETGELLQLLKIFTSGDNQVNNRIYPSELYLEFFLQNKKNHVVVATINNMIIGGLTAYEIEMYKNETSEMFLFEIDVDENYRQQGVGTLLIQKLKDVCTQQNIKQIFVIASRGNYPALKLYNTTGGKGDIESILFNYFL